MSAPNRAASAAYLGSAIISESQESTTARSIRRILFSRSKDHEIFHCHARVRVWGWHCPSPNQLFHLFRSEEPTTARSIRRILFSRSKDHEIFHCHARVRVWGWHCPSPNQLFHLFS